MLGSVLANPTSSQAAQGSCQLPDNYSGPLGQANFNGASLAFDGTYLDYTENATWSSGPNNGKPVTETYNRVFTIDPAHGCTTTGTPKYHIDATLTGGADVPLYQVTYDPRYVFPNGDLGAILARTDSGLPIGQLGATDAAVFAIDPATGTSELAFSVECQKAGSNGCQAEPSLFTYDYFRDRIWVSVPNPDNQNPDANAFLPELLVVPAHRGTRALPDARQTCFDVSVGQQPQGNAATWAVDGSGTLYVQDEDDITVRHLSSLTCGDIGAGFTHSHYGEADVTENDQMVCDSVSFSQGSVLWLRDKGSHTVQHYDIPGSTCPFPTVLTLTPPVVGGASNQPIQTCAVLQKFANGRPPLSGLPISFSVGNQPIGTVVTNANGQACATFTGPPQGARLPLAAVFAGTAALLTSRANGTVVVTGPLIQPPPNAAPQTGGIAPRPAPPPAAPVQQLSIGQQVQAQSQVQAQTQVQLQPGMSMEQEQQVQVTVQGLNGERRSGFSAVARDPSPVALLLIQLTAGLAMGVALLQRDRILEIRRRVRPARKRS